MKVKNMIQCLIVLCVMLVSSNVFAVVNESKISVDGKIISEGVIHQNGRIYLNTEALKKAFDIKATENENNILLNKNKDLFKIDKKNMTIEYNGQKSNFDVEIIKINKNTYIPIRNITNIMGYQIGWNQKTKLVSVNTKIKTSISNINVKVLSGPTAVSMANFINESIFVGKGVKTNFEILSQPQLASASVISKEADIVTLPTNTASILYNKKVDYKVAGVILWGNLYLASSELKSIEDIKGKEIFLTGKGATPDILLRMWLKDKGLNPEKDVKITYLPGAQELATYMLSGKAKTAVLPEPILTKVLMKNDKVTIKYDFQKYWKEKYKTEIGYPQTVIFVKNDLIKNGSVALDTFLYEYERNIDNIRNNRAMMAQEGAKLDIGLTAQILDKSLERSNFKYVDGIQAKSMIDTYLKALYDFDPATVGGKIPNADFYYSR